MPWDAQSFKSKHNQSLSADKAAEAASVANAILRDTGDEGKAIRIANAQANGTLHHATYKSNRRPNGSMS